MELDAVALAAAGRELEELIGGIRGGALRGHRRAPRGALLGLPCRAPVCARTRPEADRPPASMSRVAVFAYGSLASRRAPERTLGRPVEPVGRARLAGLAAALDPGRDNLALGEDLRPRRDGTDSAPSASASTSSGGRRRAPTGS